MDNIFTVFNTIITGTVSIIILYLKYMFKRKAYDPIKIQNNIDENIIAAIEFLRLELDADRVVIQEFHNGGKYFSGSSQQKLSISYESCRKGISSIFRKFQNVRVSALCNIIKRSMTNHILVDLKDETCAYSHDLQMHGTTNAVFTIVKTLTNRNIGLLSIHYVNRNKSKLTEQEEELINVQQRIISGYLVSHKIKI
tara:strand:- start:4445 stop:5035 length:591 start_codon:yes stop_codon:yes gene_type:complete